VIPERQLAFVLEGLLWPIAGEILVACAKQKYWHWGDGIEVFSFF
jgi:hypothetical protein